MACIEFLEDILRLSFIDLYPICWCWLCSIAPAERCNFLVMYLPGVETLLRQPVLMVVVWHPAMLSRVHPPGTCAFSRAPVRCNNACSATWTIHGPLVCLHGLALLHGGPLFALTVCTLVQESMAEDIETSRAVLRPWARRAEKQAARARSTSPRRSGSRRTPSADLGGQGGLTRQISMGSAGGSGERTIYSYLARSSRDGDVPELISKVPHRSVPCNHTLQRLELYCTPHSHDDVQHRHWFLSAKDGCTWGLLTVSCFSSYRCLEASRIC